MLQTYMCYPSVRLMLRKWIVFTVFLLAELCNVYNYTMLIYADGVQDGAYENLKCDSMTQVCRWTSDSAV